MPLITKFDPWKSPLCTCPEKLSLNVYTGCSHSCLYCYSSAYIKNFFKPRVKKDYLKRLRREIKNLNEKIPISISNSSDPYITLEKDFRYMQHTLKLLKGYKKLIVTKSDLIVRDIEILKEEKERVVVSITITTLDEEITKKLEPNAPNSKRRLEALKKLSNAGIPTVLRFDPVIPFINDNYEIMEEIIENAKNVGVRHVISSTYKAKRDNFRRMVAKFPELSDKWKYLYLKKGNFIHGSWYLSKKVRFEIMSKVKEIVEKRDMTFSCCREGFPKLNSGVFCDGSFLFS